MGLFMMLCRDCIIDKNARIGKNVVIANSEVCFFPYFVLKDQDDGDMWMISCLEVQLPDFTKYGHSLRLC